MTQPFNPQRGDTVVFAGRRGILTSFVSSSAFGRVRFEDNGVEELVLLEALTRPADGLVPYESYGQINLGGYGYVLQVTAVGWGMVTLFDPYNGRNIHLPREAVTPAPFVDQPQPLPAPARPPKRTLTKGQLEALKLLATEGPLYLGEAPAYTTVSRVILTALIEAQFLRFGEYRDGSKTYVVTERGLRVIRAEETRLKSFGGHTLTPAERAVIDFAKEAHFVWDDDVNEGRVSRHAVRMLTRLGFLERDPEGFWDFSNTAYQVLVACGELDWDW